MADPTFDPVAGLIDPETYSKISNEWTTFLDQPGGRAALLQSGIAMSQPLAWGQSNFGGLMGAIGSGGEAATRADVLEQKKAESESKAMLREAQAGAAEGRASMAGTKADQAQQALELKKQGMQLKAWQDLRKGYETYRSGIEKSNDANRLLNPEAVTPPMPIEQWIQSQPSARAAAEASGLFGTTGTTVPGTYSEPAAPTTAAPDTGAIVDVKTPEEAAKLKPGRRYRTPDGKVYKR